MSVVDDRLVLRELIGRIEEDFSIIVGEPLQGRRSVLLYRLMRKNLWLFGDQTIREIYKLWKLSRPPLQRAQKEVMEVYVQKLEQVGLTGEELGIKARIYYGLSDFLRDLPRHIKGMLRKVRKIVSSLSDVANQILGSLSSVLQYVEAFTEFKGILETVIK